ncbi:MAG: hypothetical protein GY714_31225 [Desulfobacterales bacterium]|nr:hypothetical protein [Desulfobacterales bacterium]MCP4162002.1 hypothetical protein [Deltaproteobacteria bacterium]
MDIKTKIPVLSMSISSETSRVNALELYNYLQCEMTFKEWIEDLVYGYKCFHEYIVVKEPAVGDRNNPIFVYYISLKVAKIASLKAVSSLGEKAYNYLKNFKPAGFISIIK